MREMNWRTTSLKVIERDAENDLEAPNSDSVDRDCTKLSTSFTQYHILHVCPPSHILCSPPCTVGLCPVQAWICRDGRQNQTVPGPSPSGLLVVLPCERISAELALNPTVYLRLDGSHPGELVGRLW